MLPPVPTDGWTAEDLDRHVDEIRRHTPPTFPELAGPPTPIAEQEVVHHDARTVAVLGGGIVGHDGRLVGGRATPDASYGRGAATSPTRSTPSTATRRYLDDALLDSTLRATSDLAEAVDCADVLVMGVPSHGFRATLAEMARTCGRGCPVIWLVKGLERRDAARRPR